MSTFEYTALDVSNTIQHGLIKGVNRSRAQHRLEHNNLTVVTISKIVGPSKVRQLLQRRVTSMDRALFTRNLMTMMRAGLSLTDALASCKDQTSNPALKRIIGEVERSVESGQPLSAAFDRYSSVFPSVYRAMVRVGERGGKLVDVLEFLARQQENDMRLMRRIRGALAYPVLIIVTMCVMVVLMMLFVIPKISTVYDEANVTLPLTTRILIATSHWITSYGAYALAALIAVIIGLRILVRKSPRFQMFMHRWTLSMPLIGPVAKKIDLVIISRSLGMLSHAGVSFDESLALTSSVAHNAVYRYALSAAQSFVRRGVKLRDVFRGNPELFLPVFYKMIVTGEQTGNLDEMFERVARYYDDDIQQWTANLSTYLEPILLLCTAAVVAGIVASVMLPLWNFANVI